MHTKRINIHKIRINMQKQAQFTVRFQPDQAITAYIPVPSILRFPIYTTSHTIVNHNYLQSLHSSYINCVYFTHNTVSI